MPRHYYHFHVLPLSNEKKNSEKRKEIGELCRFYFRFVGRQPKQDTNGQNVHNFALLAILLVFPLVGKRNSLLYSYSFRFAEWLSLVVVFFFVLFWKRCRRWVLFDAPKWIGCRI